MRTVVRVPLLFASVVLALLALVPGAVYYKEPCSSPIALYLVLLGAFEFATNFFIGWNQGYSIAQLLWALFMVVMSAATVFPTDPATCNADVFQWAYWYTIVVYVLWCLGAAIAITGIYSIYVLAATNGGNFAVGYALFLLSVVLGFVTLVPGAFYFFRACAQPLALYLVFLGLLDFLHAAYLFIAPDRGSAGFLLAIPFLAGLTVFQSGTATCDATLYYWSLVLTAIHLGLEAAFLILVTFSGALSNALNRTALTAMTGSPVPMASKAPPLPPA